MKRIILIGDSIRIGYEPTVRRELDGWAEVISPEANGGTSKNVLEHLEDWVLHHEADLAHINAGLHDLARLPENDLEPRVNLHDYKDNVHQILAATAARMKAIWARTTPVNEQRHKATKPFERREVDVDLYNAGADEVAAALDIPTHDLHGLVMTGGRDEWLVADGVHFTPEAYEALGKAVAQRIRATLA